jgi:pyruvate/2-oxoglutarate dehydrogenase complex dihydrolipoamide acyltransferase (E2) component
VVGSAVAAPQLSLGRSRSVGSSAGTNINENNVVTSVISSLTPSIARAVEEALAAVRAAEQAAADQAAAEQAAAEQAAAAAAEAERIEAQRLADAAAAAEAEAARQQQIAEANAAAAAAAAQKNSFDSQVNTDLGPFVDPVYNFEYKVADDVENTYISRNEQRDGNELSGSYSFIDATGALVTVDYTAGVNGYAETRSKEAGKVTMKAVPAWDGPLAGLEEASGAVSVAKGATSSSSRFGSSSGSRSSSAISSSSSQSDLIAQILAALTPQINSAVAAALA